MARANEQAMMAWLDLNDHLLPMSLYQISKQLDWSFGATRGTLLRLAKLPQSKLILLDVVDQDNKRFKLKVARIGKPSQNRLNQEISKNKVCNQSNSSNTNQISTNFSINHSDYHCNLEKLEEILFFLKKLLIIDDNIVELSKVANQKVLNKILELEFGLESVEKESLLHMIEEFQTTLIR